MSGPWELKPDQHVSSRWQAWTFYAGVGVLAGFGIAWLLTDRQVTEKVTTAVSRIGCDIKGNISNRGERIYHVPGQEYYSATRIDTRAGERWFCTEAEAQTAGWRKARR